MSEPNTVLNGNKAPTQGFAPGAVDDGAGVIASAAPKKEKRTLGLRLFDATFYGGVVNTAIFAASAASTYWTYHGNSVGKPGGALRKLGEAFYKRRKPIEEALGTIGIKGEAAKIGTTVFWSFFDGTLFAPLIKLIEDRRERIALSIDTVLGTKADNMRAYDAEPKQGWKSVLAGRLETLSIVLPVAIIMEYTHGNKKIFYDGGEKAMGWVEKNLPTLDKKFTKLVSAPHAPELAAEQPIRKKTLSHVIAFEAFYTSICTIGTYLFSRGFARHHTSSQPAPKTHKAENTATTTNRDEAQPTTEPKVEEKPRTKVTSSTLHNRVAEPSQEPALTT